MNLPKCSDDDYINFVIATPRSVSATEAAKVQGDEEQAPAHDAFTRLLHRLEPDAETLWTEARSQINLSQGILVIDDSTLDKPYARKMELVVRHWSGKHHRVVSGINLITLLWTDGDRHVPVDYRIFDKKNDSLTKNDHFSAMVKAARERGFAPRCVVFDSWYAGLENLKLIRSFDWIWLTRLKSNRKVNPERQGLRPISAIESGAPGRVVWLEGYGLIRVFKIVATDGDIEWWATNHLEMTDLERVKWAGFSWTIEHYHRGIKQFCLIERAQVRSRRAWRNHIGLCLRAFLRLESHCYHKGISWFEAKTAIIREAVRVYIANPLYSLISTA
ncbi:MAG: transposase [Acidobacteria bacterium]|nr:transposase [Acidobacteriota bacterium]